MYMILLNVTNYLIFLFFKNKVKLTVQGEVVAGTILQQSFVVEYVVNHQMCDDCRRVEAKDTWTANVIIFYPFSSYRIQAKSLIAMASIYHNLHLLKFFRSNYVKKQTRRKHYTM